MVNQLDHDFLSHDQALLCMNVGKAAIPVNPHVGENIGCFGHHVLKQRRSM